MRFASEEILFVGENFADGFQVVFAKFNDFFARVTTQSMADSLFHVLSKNRMVNSAYKQRFNKLRPTKVKDTFRLNRTDRIRYKNYIERTLQFLRKFTTPFFLNQVQTLNQLKETRKHILATAISSISQLGDGMLQHQGFLHAFKGLLAEWILIETYAFQAHFEDKLQKSFWKFGVQRSLNVNLRRFQKLARMTVTPPTNHPMPSKKYTDLEILVAVQK